MKDMHNNMTPVVAMNMAAISTSTTTNGIIVDRQGYEALEFVVFSATITDGTFTPLVEHSDAYDLSGSAAVPDAELFGTEAGIAFVAADDNTVKRIGYAGNKRYVRLSLVSSGVSTGGTLGAVALKGAPHLAPVA